ncbi:MAG TPA: efflux RND transporter periplasmic adaptor subunit [Syntrophorhabdaceae bacterium]|nr:efflux RND transporter periplasmic adaptor subunit [Syntrophorhabdaceae bacterium]
MKKTVRCLQAACLTLLVLALAFESGCKKKEVRAEKVTNISVQAAQTKKLRPFIEATGTLNPFEEVSIGAEIDGIIKTVRVDEGAVVSKGTLLATIDDVEYSQGVVSAKAALKQAEASFANAKIEFARKEALYKEELVTKQQFDDVSTRLTLAESDVDRAKAALSIADQKLEKTKIYAPLASRVKEKTVSRGDFVKNGTRLFSLIQPSPLKLRFSVSELDVGKMKVGQDVVLKVDSFPDREFRGKVSIVFPSLEEKTRTLLIEALIPDQAGILKPGLFARVVLYTGEPKDTVVIPVTAILYEADKTRVFVAEGERARERFVILGNKYGEEMEIPEGVNAGEQVVVAGQQNLSDGARVSIQKGKGQSQEGESARGSEHSESARAAGKPVPSKSIDR